MARRRELITYIDLILKNTIYAISYDKEGIQKLKKIGFVSPLFNYHKRYVLRCDNENMLLEKLKMIRNMRIPFAAGYKGDPPYWRVLQYKEEGLFPGNFRIIGWSSLDKCRIYEIYENGEKKVVEEINLSPEEIIKLQNNSLVAKVARFIFYGSIKLKNKIFRRH